MTNRKRAGKVTAGHKITLAALSVLGVAAGWNLIGREAGITADSLQTAVEPTTVAPPPAVVPGPTPWPTIAPLPDLPRLTRNPVPTLVAVAVSDDQSVAAAGNPGEQTTSLSASSLPSLAPLPTMAPLPAMPEYVAPPPPPAPAPQVAAAPPPPPSGGGDVSKGS